MAGLLSPLRAGLLKDVVLLLGGADGSLAARVSADDRADLLDGPAVLLATAMVSFLFFIVFFLAEHRANRLGEKLEECRGDPGGEAEDPSDEPVVAVDATSRNLESIFSHMHDGALTSADEDVDEAEGPVVEDSLENVEGIVNDSRVDQVEDAHDHEYIENIG